MLSNKYGEFLNFRHLHFLTSSKASSIFLNEKQKQKSWNNFVEDDEEVEALETNRRI